ncbi:TonB-dependent siderophore receptor [Methylosinus sp. LW4]|uniref:TonB-dependent siderophore receptor n=1 Tax=Methylosinus sp. LW4 TaxID=136993 RepID=UPI0012FABBF5|nr:TonB-dependent receptor [Methylosinus sp. LW4]
MSAVLAAAMGVLAFGGDAPASAHARMPAAEIAAEVKSYRIPAGSVGMALARIAEQNGLQLVFLAGLTRNVKTSGLAGDYTLGGALDRLLAGTGLGYRLADNQRDVFIVLAQNDTGVRSDAGAEALPAIDIGAERPRAGGPGSGKGEGLTSQNSYVVPNASTATKTDTPVMNTPINVQTITQKALEDQQATTLRDALQNVSGVTIVEALGQTSQRTAGFFVRGFATQEFYQDGVRVTGVTTNGAGTIDIAGTKQFANIGGIELLKGPAAILYGLSEPGGIVNITTRAPLDTPHYAIQQQIGALAFYRTSLSATGPVTSDKSVLYRVDMSYENNGAPFGSVIDRTHSRNFFVAPVVKWQIDNDTWIKAEVNYSNDLSSLYEFRAASINGTFLDTPRNTSLYGFGQAFQPTVYAALTGAHNFNDDWSLRSRVTFYSTNSNAITDPALSTSAGSNPLITLGTSYSTTQMSSWQTNQDLVGHFDLLGAKNTLLLGGDYSRFTSASISQGFVPWGWSAISLLNPIFPGVPASPLTSTNHQESYNRQDTAGVYVQDQIELPYGFHVMAGARYQYVFQWNTLASRSASFVSGPVSNSGIPAHMARVTPRFGLLWRPQSWVSLYGNYTEGFAANSGTIYPGTPAPPTDAESWEAGAKFEFFDGRLRANIDYYNLVKTNVPISDPDATHLCNGTPSCISLVGKARSSGPEIDIQGELLPGWNVILNYTNQDVRVAEGTQQSGLKPGQRYPNVPRNLARLWTTYEFQVPELKGLKVGAGYTYHGSQPPFDVTAGRVGAVPLLWSYGLVDLMAAYSFDLDGVKTTAQINATNIFDRSYYTFARVQTLPSSNYNVINGRTWGAPFNIVGSLKFEF